MVLSRHTVSGGLLAASLFALMAVTGIGTGPGPLDPGSRHGAAVTRDVGADFTVGNVTLVNEGRLPVQVESIRLLPEDDADRGVDVTAVEVAPVPPAGSRGYIGIADGPGYDEVPASVRRAPRGAVLAARAAGQDHGGLLQVLVRARVRGDGAWSFRGYEVTYRSGVVRHRAVLDVSLTACAPRSRFPDGCETPG